MKSCCMTAGLEPAYDMQWQRQGTALLLRHGASHWDALHTAQQPQAGTNSTYRCDHRSSLNAKSALMTASCNTCARATLVW